MTAYNIARMRVKAGRQDEFRDLFHQHAGGEAGNRRVALLRASETSHFVVGEWESYDALADSRTPVAAKMALIRPLLEDLGGGLGISYAVSGEAIVELGSYAPEAPAPRPEGATPRAYNVVRHRVKAGAIADFEAGLRSAFATPFPRELDGLNRIVLVSVGARSYCLLSQWESLAHLVKARPLLDRRIESQRDLLEDIGGGQGAANVLSGEVVVEHSYGDAG